MSSQLTDKELAELLPSEMLPHRTPVPTQIVSSDEFIPIRRPSAKEGRGAPERAGRRLGSEARACRAGASSRPRPAWRRPSSR